MCQITARLMYAFTELFTKCVNEKCVNEENQMKYFLFTFQELLSKF